jgi:hypothetical protein
MHDEDNAWDGSAENEPNQASWQLSLNGDESLL